MVIIACLLVSSVLYTRTDTVFIRADTMRGFYEASYKAYLDSHGYVSGLTPVSHSEIAIDIFSFETSADMDTVILENGVGTSDTGTISWRFYVEDTGFYNLAVGFIPMSGTNSQIRRVISLNGAVLHNGLRQAAFNRTFREGIIEVHNNNEIRPASQETFRESTVFVGDSLKRSLEPYLFYLSAGEHTLEFESAREPMIITNLRFASAAHIPSYSEYRSMIQAPVYSGPNLVFEAERTSGDAGSTLEIRKSQPSITVRNAFFDPGLIPFHPYRIVFNTIGGETWRTPGDIIEWDIHVPQEALYALSFKARQSVNRGVISYRNVKINGVSPFAEAQSMGFSYSESMVNFIPGRHDGGYSPLLFHLQEGLNTLSMEIVLGAFGSPYAQVSESVMILNDLYRRIVQITGVFPDRFIDYEVSAKIPDFTAILENEHDRLLAVVEDLKSITVERGTNTTMVERIIEQMRRLLRRPDNITLELDQFQGNIAMLATWLITVAEMPLELDSFTLMAGESLPAPARAHWTKRLVSDITRFFASFVIDITAIDTAAAGGGAASIKVWFPSGRDQAEVLRSLIDQRFIPRYNINVTLELIPIDVVVPATLSGVGPDVVLNLDQARLMDFALRNALVDLSVLDGFDEQARLFFPSALEGITFTGRTFGLPETQTFNIMFYRRDIFESLGIVPPQTWDELRALIPIFHMHNYDVWVPNPGPLASLIIQRGGHLYLGQDNDFGIASGLLEEPAMEAFKEFTDFFTAYKLPVALDFSNRFRTGEVPMGIADYTTYYTLELFAPEIRGLWSFALLPGIPADDGTIDNRVVTVTTQSAILNAAQDRGVLDEAWTFLRWWLSTEVQTEFANGIEAILGPSARYATANRDVLLQLPWSAADAARLLEQFEATTSFPQVPGHYMTNRMIDYAFRAVVTRGANPRETLFLNTRAINQELTKKRREFSLSYIDHGGR